MADDAVYELLGRLTEDMYLGFAKAQSDRMQDQLMRYHSVAENKISELIQVMSQCNAGEAVLSQKRKIQIFHDDFKYMKNDINSKYKIYIRGCGKAGKSTLLNALLSLDESVGSRMGRLPMTFIVDTYTDELTTEEAQVRTIGRDGMGEFQKVTRSQAIAMENEEESAFSRSKDKCRRLIEEKTKDVYLEQEREDIETDIYKRYLMRTKIREIKWGIGRNYFFHNCILIDTPGLSQELRFTNVIEDVKNYEVDGIIWVISSETLAKQEVTDAYKKEFQEMKEIYEGKKVIAVINMYGSTSDYKYGSRLWKRVEKKARKIYCGKDGFDDLICVNARMAYDGNVNEDHKQMDESNISQLRKKINELFVERSSESVHYAKLDKIDAFLSNLCREVEKYKADLDKYIRQYGEKLRMIKSQSSACQNIVKERKDKVISRHLADIRNRIESNSGRIEHLNDETYDTRNRFINKEIVKTDILNHDLQEAMIHCQQLIYSRFKEQQVMSIVSNFKTEQFALQAFQEAHSSLTMDGDFVKSDFQIDFGLLDGLGKWVMDAFGKNDFTKVVRGILQGISNMIESPQDRLYKSIKSSITKSADRINLSEDIGKYEEMCIETLDKSMAQSCGSYEDVKKLKRNMENYISNQPHMEWEKVGLQELMEA